MFQNPNEENLRASNSNESKVLALLEPVLLEKQCDSWSCAWRVLVLPVKSFVDEWRLTDVSCEVCLYVMPFVFLGFGEGGGLWGHGLSRSRVIRDPFLFVFRGPSKKYKIYFPMIVSTDL